MQISVMAVSPLAADPSWTDVFVAAVAGMAFILSIVSLVLQYVAWRHSGPRVRVVASQAFIVWATPQPQDVLTITASNAGRAGTQVRQWWLQPVQRTNGTLLWQGRWAPAGDHIVFPMHVNGSDPLPATLEPSASLSWMVDWGAVQDTMKRYGITAVRPWVGLGSGAEVRGKDVLVLEETPAK